MEEISTEDPAQLLEAASDFAYYPGVQNEASVKNFLDRFPLPVIISALQTKAEISGLESILVACLERIFKTQYGASLIPHYMAFVQVGLQADSQVIRCLACKTVCCLLAAVDTGVELVEEYGIYPFLLNCLTDGNEQVVTASMDAIKGLASSKKGLDMIFPAKSDESTNLRTLLARCSSLGRVRVFSLIVKLFSVSSHVASIIYDSELLSLLVSEVSSTSDMLLTLNVLELLYELSEIPHGTEFLPRATFVQLLSSIIRDKSVDSMLRTRSIMISGRLLRSEGIFTIDESSVIDVLSTIDGTLELLKGEDTDESESAVEALGQIGSSIKGAELLFSSSAPVGRHVVDEAFNGHGRGVQLAALHALGNISGEGRPVDSKMMNDSAEVRLRQLIYEAAARSSKLTPSAVFLSLLQKETDMRWAAYRLISGLVIRPWCLIEICAKLEIINIVTDAYAESTKNDMEARYNCCKAIHQALIASSSKLSSDPSLAGMAAKLHEAVRRGPYLIRERIEAQPVVMTAERF